MAITKEQVRNEYPLPVYNYRVDIDGETIAFSQVSGLDRSVETITFKESKTEPNQVGPRILYMPGQPVPINLSLQKGIVRTKSIPIFYEWINSIQANVVDKKDITVSLCDETGVPVITWKVVNAFPTKISAPSFDANSNEIAVEGLDLMADTILVQGEE